MKHILFFDQDLYSQTPFNSTIEIKYLFCVLKYLIKIIYIPIINTLMIDMSGN